MKNSNVQKKDARIDIPNRIRCEGPSNGISLRHHGHKKICQKEILPQYILVDSLEFEAGRKHEERAHSSW